MNWKESGEFRYIDAWDVAEWVGSFPGKCANRYWQGPIGGHTWGAYKNLVTTFRVVIDYQKMA